MTRPAILDQDVVVVPHEPTLEMYDMFWQQTGESREMYSRVCARAGRHHTVMLAASPHADAWAEVRAYVGELERLKTCGMTELASSNPSAMDYVKHWEGRVQSAEARTAELEARLKEAERVIAPFAAWFVRDAETIGGFRFGVATSSENFKAAVIFMEGSK